jgi:hypothetical protein
MAFGAFAVKIRTRHWYIRDDEVVEDPRLPFARSTRRALVERLQGFVNDLILREKRILGKFYSLQRKTGANGLFRSVPLPHQPLFRAGHAQHEEVTHVAPTHPQLFV